MIDSKQIYTALLFSTIWAIQASAQPVIQSGKLLTAEIDVSKPAASPEFIFHTSEPATTLAIQYQGPSSEIFGQLFQLPGTGSKVFTLRGYRPMNYGNGGYQTAFTLYTEPGVWSIGTLTVCNGQSCSYYDQTQIAALLGTSTFTIKNPNKPDILAPYVSSGTIVTPIVSISSGKPLQIVIGATDDVSGVSTISVCATGGIRICTNSEPPTSPVLRGRFLTSLVIPAGTPLGTYTIQGVFSQDIAGNFVSQINPGQLNPIFSGNLTFNITQ